ncbi:hypothetical protein ACOMHN_046255 [Nucella lapillus]
MLRRAQPHNVRQEVVAPFVTDNFLSIWPPRPGSTRSSPWMMTSRHAPRVLTTSGFPPHLEKLYDQKPCAVVVSTV